MHATHVQGPRTFLAGEALEAHRRVKVKTGTSTSPPEVVYADAGDACIGVTEAMAKPGETVAVRQLNDNGTFIVIAGASFAIGADLFGADDGKVSAVANGTAQFKALTAAGANGDEIEASVHSFVSTTASTTSIADAGGFTDQTTVEGATQEIYQHLKSVQAFIPVPLTSLREASSFAVGNAAANGGVLASDTTPILAPVNGGTDGCQRVNWAAGNADPVIFQVPLPPDLDDAADVVVHARAAMGGATNTPVITAEGFFNEGDTKVSVATAAVTGTGYSEYTAIFGAADVPSGAQTLTVSLTPGAHAADALYLTALWIEYKRKILTS